MSAVARGRAGGAKPAGGAAARPQFFPARRGRAPRLGPVALRAGPGRRRGRGRRREIRANRGCALLRPLRGEAPPAEPEPAGVQQRVGPAVDEPVELHGGAVVPAHAPERFAEPEADVARERPRRAPGPERLPRGHCLVVPAERVAREPQTVSRHRSLPAGPAPPGRRAEVSAAPMAAARRSRRPPPEGLAPKPEAPPL